MATFYRCVNTKSGGGSATYEYYETEDRKIGLLVVDDENKFGVFYFKGVTIPVEGLTITDTKMASFVTQGRPNTYNGACCNAYDDEDNTNKVGDICFYDGLLKLLSINHTTWISDTVYGCMVVCGNRGGSEPYMTELSIYKNPPKVKDFLSIIGGNSAPESDIGDNGDIYYQYSEYTQSIKSLDFTTGGVFLPVCGSTVSRYVMKFTMTGGSSYACPLGSQTSNSSNNFLLFTKYNGSYDAEYAMNGRDTLFGDLTSYFDANKNLVLDISASNITLSDGTNDVTVTPSQVNDFCTPTMCVGAMANGNKTLDTLTYCEMNFYSLDVYENDVLVGRFIPAQDNGTDGLLEVFSNKFYAKTGTVSSTAMTTPQKHTLISKVYTKVNGEWINIIGENKSDAIIPKKDRILAHFDFTESLTDIVDGRTATLSGATRDSNGITIDSATEYVSFDPALLRIDTAYEIKFGTVNLTPATNTHSKLITWKYGGDTPTEAGFTFHYQTQKWSVWDAETLWQDSDISDINYFNNATLKIYIDVDGNWHFYKDDVLFFETTTPLPITRLQTFRLGSDNKSCWTCTIQSFKVISPWGTEFDKTESNRFHVERYVGDPLTGSITLTDEGDYMLYAPYDSAYISDIGLTVNGVSINTELSNNVIAHANLISDWGYCTTTFSAHKGDTLAWSCMYDTRPFEIFSI